MVEQPLLYCESDSLEAEIYIWAYNCVQNKQLFIDSRPLLITFLNWIKLSLVCVCECGCFHIQETFRLVTMPQDYRIHDLIIRSIQQYFFFLYLIQLQIVTFAPASVVKWYHEMLSWLIQIWEHCWIPQSIMQMAFKTRLKMHTM